MRYPLSPANSTTRLVERLRFVLTDSRRPSGHPPTLRRY